MDRRTFLKGLTAVTAAGLLIPERKVWALDRTMVQPVGGIVAPAYDVTTQCLETGWFDAGSFPFTKRGWYEIVAMGQDFDGSTWVQMWDGKRQWIGIDPVHAKM